MTLEMTADEYREAYPNGMDDDDREAWALAVDRSRSPEDDCAHRNAADGYCPDCGYDAEAAAERRAGC